jgi:hypothetical protein
VGGRRIWQLDRVSVQRDRACIGRDLTGQDLRQRRLAGAVFAAEGKDFSPAHVEGDPAHRLDAAERFGDVRQLETWIFG